MHPLDSLRGVPLTPPAVPPVPQFTVSRGRNRNTIVVRIIGPLADKRRPDVEHVLETVTGVVSVDWTTSLAWLDYGRRARAVVTLIGGAKRDEIMVTVRTLIEAALGLSQELHVAEYYLPLVIPTEAELAVLRALLQQIPGVRHSYVIPLLGTYRDESYDIDARRIFLLGAPLSLLLDPKRYQPTPTVKCISLITDGTDKAYQEAHEAYSEFVAHMAANAA
ncbi:MAG TPA: hypothetical protein VLF91_03630 [Candidatus Saccharimonadales bacterium]|nr:hypothetical protein [Candidatus Saccharimonadales bacterium]